MAHDDSKPERSISKARLVKIHRAFEVAASRIGEERGQLAQMVTKAEEEQNFDKVAFALVRKLSKYDNGKQSRILRNIELYCDHLGIGGQTDLEDVIDQSAERDARTADAEDAEAEDVVDDLLSDKSTVGDDFEQPPRDPNSGVVTSTNPERDLNRFDDAIGEAGISAKQVQQALANFVTDHPDLAERAERLVELRLAEIGEELPPPRRGGRKPAAAASPVH